MRFRQTFVCKWKNWEQQKHQMLPSVFQVPHTVRSHRANTELNTHKHEHANRQVEEKRGKRVKIKVKVCRHCTALAGGQKRHDHCLLLLLLPWPRVSQWASEPDSSWVGQSLAGASDACNARNDCSTREGQACFQEEIAHPHPPPDTHWAETGPGKKKEGTLEIMTANYELFWEENRRKWWKARSISVLSVSQSVSQCLRMLVLMCGCTCHSLVYFFFLLSWAENWPSSVSYRSLAVVSCGVHWPTTTTTTTFKTDVRLVFSLKLSSLEIPKRQCTK